MHVYYYTYIILLYYTSVDPKYWVLWIQWQAVECGAKACKSIIRGRVRYRMHRCTKGKAWRWCKRNSNKRQRVVESGLSLGNDNVWRGRNRHITKRQAVAGSLSTSNVYTSKVRTGDELHLPHICFSITARSSRCNHCCMDHVSIKARAKARANVKRSQHTAIASCGWIDTSQPHGVTKAVHKLCNHTTNWSNWQCMLEQQCRIQ